MAAKHKRVSVERWYTETMARRLSGHQDPLPDHRCREMSHQTSEISAKDTQQCSDSSVGTNGKRQDAGMFFNLDEIDHSPQLERQPRFSGTSETVKFDMDTGDDDPLESILNLTADESALLLNEAGASISAALDAVVNEIQSDNTAAKAYANVCAREKFEPKPSPLGLGMPAMQYDASLWPPQLPKVTIPGDFFYNAPKRLVSKERQAQLDRYRAKRERRLLGLHKVTRYECRKTLADARVRVKGRFVKASAEGKAVEAMKSIQSCPDLSALVEGSDGSKAKFIPSSDDSVIYANKDSSKRRISDDTTSSSDTSQGESLDFKKLQQLGDDGEPSTASGLDSHSTVSALRRTKKKQMRHCDSEICLTDLVGM